VLLVTLYNSITAPLVINGPKPVDTPLVSILIPARNEEENIKACLNGLLNQEYPNLEIIVLDDLSSDRTSEIVEEYAQKNNRVSLLRGIPTPPGWTGKNWACHQSSKNARGEFFIFTDADNTHNKMAVANTVGWMQSLQLGLFSSFPQQITKTISEKLVIPVIDMMVYSYLPLWLTYYSKFSSLSAANGQWIAFTKESYNKIGGHEIVRSEIVEDVKLARRAKKLGMKILTASGKNAVSGRMYRSWREVWQGFSKNLFGLVEYKTIPFFLILCFMIIAFVLPYFLAFIDTHIILAVIGIILNILIRLILSLKYNHPLLTSIILHPLSIIITVTIAINSYYCYKKGSLYWKGKKINLRDRK